MAATLVGQFHARDAEGRVYSVHEFQDLEAAGGITYKLAIGDRVKKLNDEEYQLVQSEVILVRDPAPVV